MKDIMLYLKFYVMDLGKFTGMVILVFGIALPLIMQTVWVFNHVYPIIGWVLWPLQFIFIILYSYTMGIMAGKYLPKYFDV